MARLPVRDNFDLQNQKVTNLANPTDPQDAATRQWVQDQLPSETGTGNYRGSWASTNSYSRGDVVYYETDTFFYITRAAIAANTLINPSLSTNWRRIDATGGEDTGSFRGLWAQNTAYTTGQVLFTDDTESMFSTPGVQNKIYRVENNFTSSNVFDTTNLAILAERNTQYGFTNGTSGTFTVTPTDTLLAQIVDTGAADREVPIRLWNTGITYAVGDQVMHNGGSNVNSIYICRDAHTSTIASSSRPENNQDQWFLVRSGIVSVQGPDDDNPDPLTGNATLHLREGDGINITRVADTADFTISATETGTNIPSGTAFPTSPAPAEGDFFFLQADIPGFLQGLYEFSGGSWIAGNTERTDAEINTLIDGRVEQFARDTTTEIPNTKLSALYSGAPSASNIDDSWLDPATLERIRFARLNGTTFELYYTTDASGTPISVPLTSLQNVPLRRYDTIALRDADTTITQTIFAAVLDDTGDGSANPMGSSAVYILSTLPNPLGSTTNNSNWTRITAPDTILNTVMNCIYRPFLTADGQPSRNPADSSRTNPAAGQNGLPAGYVPVESGQLSDTGGILRDDADVRYLRIDDGNTAQSAANTAAQTHARSVIAAAGDQQLRDTRDALENEIRNEDVSNLPYEGASYTLNSNLSGNLNRNNTEDVYNSLGLFLNFDNPATDPATNSEFYIFDTGADTGTHVLTLRRNGESSSVVTGGFVSGFDVIFGFQWLEQFLSPPPLFGHTRDVDLNVPAAATAFANFYTRDAVTRDPILRLNATTDTARWVEAEDTITGSSEIANNIPTVGAVNTAVNSRLQVTGTPAANLIPKISAFRSTTDFDVTWQADEQGSGGDTLGDGFGVRSLGSATSTSTATRVWPNGAADLVGNSGWTYTPGSMSASATQSEVWGSFTNNTGGTVSVINGRVDVTIEVSNIAAGSHNFTLSIENTSNPPGSTVDVFNMTLAITGNGTYTFSDTTARTTADFANILNGQSLNFYITVPTTALATFSVTTAAVSLDANEFVVPEASISTFAGLTDTPANYTGNAGNVVQVNSSQDGLIFNQLKELASDFNANQFYERGDMVTVLGADTNFQYWTLNVASLNGRSTPIGAADQPGGANNAWQLFQTGDTNTVGDEYPLTGGFAFGGLGQANLAANSDGWYWPGGSNTSARYNSGANDWNYSTPASTYNDNDDDTTGPLQLAARLSVGGRFTNATGSSQTIRRIDIDINATTLPSDGSTTPILFLDNYDVSDPSDNGNRFAFTDITINSLGKQTITLDLSTATVAEGTSLTLDANDYIVVTFSEGASTESPVIFDIENVRISSTTSEFTRISSGGDSLTADAVEALDLDFSASNIPQIDGSNITTADQTYIPVYFQVNSSGQATDLNLNPTTTSTHYANVRSDGYGIITVFNSDGTLASGAASSLNTLENNDPPRVTFQPLFAENANTTPSFTSVTVGDGMVPEWTLSEENNGDLLATRNTTPTAIVRTLLHADGTAPNPLDTEDKRKLGALSVLAGSGNNELTAAAFGGGFNINSTTTPGTTLVTTGTRLGSGNGDTATLFFSGGHFIATGYSGPSVVAGDQLIAVVAGTNTVWPGGTYQIRVRQVFSSTQVLLDPEAFLITDGVVSTTATDLGTANITGDNFEVTLHERGTMTTSPTMTIEITTPAGRQFRVSDTNVECINAAGTATITMDFETGVIDAADFNQRPIS